MYSDSENDQSDSEIEVAKLTPNVLPHISKKKYESAYQSFMDWLERQNNTKSFEENILIDYFVELISKNFKSSTLLTQYSMLRATLLQHNDVDITQYIKLRAFLRRHSDGYRPKTSKIFTSQEIDKFINEAPDYEYLVTKVALIMGVLGACRRHELHKMRTTHFNDLGTAVLVTVPDNRTKMVRNFTITGRFYEFYKKYTQLRPRNVNDPWFFLNYQKGKCSTQRIGLNKFGTMGRQIANYLGLPESELYTGHCFRKSSATIIVDNDGNGASLNRFCSNWKYGVAQDIADESVPNKTPINVERPSTSSSKAENGELQDDVSSPAPIDKCNYRERELELEEKRLGLEERRLDLDERRLEIDQQNLELERSKLELEKKERETRLQIIDQQQDFLALLFKKHLDNS